MLSANNPHMTIPAATYSSKVAETGMLIDNIAKHPTPEGLMLTLMPAGLLPRLWAWLIDLLIRAIIIIVVGIISAFFGTAGTGIIAVAYFIITWLYPVYFEVYRGGMTPGKKKQGIYVCHDNGTPISLQSSMIRNLLRVADFLPFGFAAGILTIMFTQRSQRLGDIIAGTLVVYKQQDNLEKLYKSIYGFDVHQSSQQASNDIPIDVKNTTFELNSPLFFYPLRLNEQQALVSYVERLDFLSVARQQEIANALTPLVKPSVRPSVANAQILADSAALQQLAVQQAVLYKARMIQGGVSMPSINISASNSNINNAATGANSTMTSIAIDPARATQDTHTDQDKRR